MPQTKAFKKIEKAVRKTYLGKPVPAKFRNLYGKRYDKKEVKRVAIAIARSRGVGV